MDSDRILVLASKFAALAKHKTEANWAYHVRTYEGDDKNLVLEHIFYGKSKNEAKGYAKAHKKTDSFFHDCLSKNKWKDVECSNDTWWEQVNE